MTVFTKQRRFFSILASIIALSLVLSACGSANGTGAGSSSTPAAGGGASANGKGCTKVGVLLPETASSARWDSKDRPLLDAAIKAAIPGATVDETNAQGNADDQQTQAEQDLTKGDCILVVAPVDQGKAATIVAKAKAQGVPVIAYDRMIQSKDLSYYVSFDGKQVGELQGQYILDHYKDYTKSGHNNVVMINGSQTDDNAILFYQGAISKLQPAYDSKTLTKIYDQYTPDWNNATAQTEMEAALTAHANDVQVAYVANDGMANNVIAALKAQHLNGKVLVTGQDATVAGIQNILKGDQMMTVYKAITKEADATAQVVKALHDGTTPSTNGSASLKDGGSIPAMLLESVAVDKTNIADTVLKDNYVTKSDICQGVPAGAGGVC